MLPCLVLFLTPTFEEQYDTATVPQVRSQHNALPSPQFDTTRARASSPTLSSAPAVSEKLVRKTLDAWIESGFLRL